MTAVLQQRVLILDFGSQYTQLIARRVRELGVYCEITPFDFSADRIREFSPAGIILSGGPETVTVQDTPRVCDVVFELGCPVLGICYGMQTMVSQLGGEVESAPHREFGHTQIRVDTTSALFHGLGEQTDSEGHTHLDVWMSHADKVTQLPPGFTITASSDNAAIAAISDSQRHLYGVQFHPEVTHTPLGTQMIDRFLKQICACVGSWTPQNIIQEAIHRIQQQVGDQQVLLAISGGVDSSVLAALLHKAIGSQLTCMFIDNGLLRQHEAAQVMATFGEHLEMRVIKVDAADTFLQALSGIADPELKRKTIGECFIRVFEREAEQLPGIQWLAQGTIYPDVIESGASKFGNAHVIKSHHNVGGLPNHMNLKLLEPLRELFKDEVRKIGLELGLAHDMVYRHPFPGAGLGIRVLGEIKNEYLEVLRQADAIFMEALLKHDLYHKVAQAFCVFLPVKSVAVMGDARKYEYVIALRAVESVDFMTAHWAHLPYDFLGDVSNRIMNEVPGISRVTYDISGKPPATIEWE